MVIRCRMMMMSQFHKVQMSNNIKNISALVTAVNSVVAFAIYYHVALTTGVKLQSLYFLSISVNFSFLFITLYFCINNIYIRACLLGASLFFGGLSIAFIIDWVGNDIPKMNNVYLCFIIGISTSLLIILYQWIKRYYTHK